MTNRNERTGKKKKQACFHQALAFITGFILYGCQFQIDPAALPSQSSGAEADRENAQDQIQAPSERRKIERQSSRGGGGSGGGGGRGRSRGGSGETQYARAELPDE